MPVEWYIAYVRFFDQLHELMEDASHKDYTLLEIKGVVKQFESTFEAAWQLLRDYMMAQDVVGSEINSPRKMILLALNSEIISDGGIWLSMQQERNLTTHNYAGQDPKGVLERINQLYLPLFKRLQNDLRPDRHIEQS